MSLRVPGLHRSKQPQQLSAGEQGFDGPADGDIDGAAGGAVSGAVMGAAVDDAGVDDRVCAWGK